jgi:hypothetical protein
MLFIGILIFGKEELPKAMLFVEIYRVAIQCTKQNCSRLFVLEV